MEQAPQQKLDFSKYVHILLRRKWWGIIPLLVLIPATIFIAFKLPKKYPAQCMLYIGATPSEEEVARRIDRDTMAENKLQDIRNRMLDYNNIRQLIVGSTTSEPIRGLADDIDTTDEVEIEKLYEEIRKEVRISLEGHEYILVTYRGKTPEIALSVVSELVDKFLDSWIGTVKSGHQEALERRNDELDSLRRQLDAADAKLRRFRKEHTKELLTRDPGSLVKKFDKLRERLSEIEWELESKKRKRAYLKERLQETPSRKEASSKYERSVMRLKLEEAIADVKIGLLLMRDRYTPDHPEVKKREAELELLEAEREKTTDEKTEVTFESNPIYDKFHEAEKDVELEIQMLESERASNLAQQMELKEEIAKLPQLQEQMAKYEREIEGLKLLYNGALQAKAEAERRFELARFARINSFQKLTIRSSPKPDYSTVLKFVAMGLFATVAAAAAAMVGAEYLDQSFTSVDEARDFLRIPSLGVVPVIVTPRDVRRRKKIRWAVGIGILLLIGAAVVASWSIPELRDKWVNLYRELLSRL